MKSSEEPSWLSFNRLVSHIAGKVSGILFVPVYLHIFDLLSFQGFNTIVTVPLTCVLLTWDCEILYGIHCLVCKIHCNILHGLLGLLCEEWCSFFTVFFDKVYINWGICFARTRLSRQLPICLVCMLYAYVHFGTSVFRQYLLIKYFSFILMHLSFDCIDYEVFFFCICSQIAIACRFHVRGLNIHMASIHGDRIGFTIFLLLYTKFSGQ